MSDGALWPAIIGMATVTFAVRWWGLALPTARVRGFWRRFLTYVPVAVFAALVVPGMPGVHVADSAWRAAAAAVTVVVTARTRSLPIGMSAGIVVYGVVRAFALN